MPAQISLLIVKIVQPCNLNCSYCYMYNHADRTFRQRPAFMPHEVFDAMIEKITHYLDAHPGRKMAIVFHGGEPMLFPPRKLDEWLTSLPVSTRSRLRLGIQTNATIVTDEWIDLLRHHSMRTSVSLDGPPTIHDASRVDHQGRGSYERVVKGLEALIAAQLDPGILCVINPRVSGLEIYKHFRSLGLKRMDFLLPDVSHDLKPKFYSGTGPTPVADYLIPIFDEWFREDDPDIRIRLFRELIRGFMGAPSRTDAFGSTAQDYVVIDSDGTIEANDALKVCYEGAIESGLNIRTHGLDEFSRSHSPLFRQLLGEGLELCGQCQACPERDMCHGGSVPHRYSTQNQFMNASVWCEDMLKLIRHVRSAIAMTPQPQDVQGAAAIAGA
jgi:uncharacterized protein